MIILEEYTSKTADGLLYKIYSDKGFFLQNNGTTYSEVIISTVEEKDNYTETQIPIPEEVAGINEIYNTFFGNYQNITKQQIKQAKQIELKALRNLPDEEAYLIKFLFEEWRAATTYQVGDRVLYQNELYNVIAVPSNNLFPPDNPECYSLVEKPLDLVEEWNNINRKKYSVGEKTKVGIHYYESLIEGNTWSPQDFPTAWKLIQ